MLIYGHFIHCGKNVNIPRIDAGVVLCTQRQIKLYSTMDGHE